MNDLTPEAVARAALLTQAEREKLLSDCADWPGRLFRSHNLSATTMALAVLNGHFDNEQRTAVDESTFNRYNGASWHALKVATAFRMAMFEEAVEKLRKAFEAQQARLRELNASIACLDGKILSEPAWQLLRVRPRPVPTHVPEE
jgi:hypothetical protein